MEHGLAVLLAHVLQQLVAVLVPRDRRLRLAHRPARDSQRLLRFL